MILLISIWPPSLARAHGPALASNAYPLDVACDIHEFHSVVQSIKGVEMRTFTVNWSDPLPAGCLLRDVIIRTPGEIRFSGAQWRGNATNR